MLAHSLQRGKDDAVCVCGQDISTAYYSSKSHFECLSGKWEEFMQCFSFNGYDIQDTERVAFDWMLDRLLQ